MRVCEEFGRNDRKRGMRPSSSAPSAIWEQVTANTQETTLPGCETRKSLDDTACTRVVEPDVSDRLQVGSDGEERLLTDDLVSRLAEIDLPALVLVGESDYADFHALADRLSGSLPLSTRETIPGAGHLPSLEQPAAFDAVVLPFLATVS